MLGGPWPCVGSGVSPCVLRLCARPVWLPPVPLLIKSKYRERGKVRRVQTQASALEGGVPVLLLVFFLYVFGDPF